MTENDAFEKLSARLYLDLLQTLSLEDSSLQNIVLDIALGSVLDESDAGRDYSMPERRDLLTNEEVLRYGTPARNLLNDSTRQRLLNEVQTTLQSIAGFFYADIHGGYPNDEEIKSNSQKLHEDIRLRKDEISSLKEEIKTLSYRLTEQMDEIDNKSKDLDRDLTQATATVFPAHDAARTASIDLLAAAIEASLIKLSLTKARAERALYTYCPGQKRNKEGRTVAQAISTTFDVLKKDERDMEIEIYSLDRQLEEYETLLDIVDGGNGGYQQIINDWTKVKQETDECLNDLRRLGWTGD